MTNIIKPVCVFIGPVASLSGYGADARSRVSALINWGKFDVKIVPTRWGGTPNTALDAPTPLNEEIKKRILTEPLKSQPELQIQVTIPNEFQPQAQFNIGITAGIETTLPKAEWIEGLNRMNFTIVPSNFAKEVLEKAGFTKTHPDGRQEPIRSVKPIDVVFEGVDMSVFKKTDEPSADIDKTLEAIPEQFNYLFVGHWLQGDIGADRKDVGMLVKVFCEVFSGKKNKPALILKTSGATFSKMDKDEVLKKINAIRNSIGDNDLPNIYLLHGDLTPTEMNRLYNHPKVKVHVSLTHGEGFGRPLLEATLSGKPLLVTDWSGHLDFLPTDLANLLPGEVKPVPQSAVNEWIVKESGWFVANYSIVAQKLEDAFKNYLSYIPKAEKLRIQNTEKFTQENEAKLFIETLEKRLPKFEQKVVPVLPSFKKVGGTTPTLPTFKKVGPAV